MKKQGKSSKLLKGLMMTLGAMLIVGMMPFYSMFGIGDGNAYAYTPTASGQNAYADGSTWTASGTAGLNYFKKIYGTGNTITSWKAGNYISGVNYVTQNITVSAGSNTSGLIINGNTTIVLLNNATLTVTGGNSYNQNGAGAGIELRSGYTLTVDGQGTIKATGGKGSDGEDGQTPSGGDWSSDSFAGKGGYGGRGGGGAGAGIGTKGGAGGARQTSVGSGDAADGDTYAGKGSDGNWGQNSPDSGTLKVYGNVNIIAKGGQGADKSGKGGEAGNKPSSYHRASSGGGGGGGGGGLPGNNIGSGGPGGGSGGSGSGGATSRPKGGDKVGGSGGGGGGGTYVGSGSYNNYGRGGGTDGQGDSRTGANGTNSTQFNKKPKKPSESSGTYRFDGAPGGGSKKVDKAHGAAGGNGGSSGLYGISGAVYWTKLGSSPEANYRGRFSGWGNNNGTDYWMNNNNQNNTTYYLGMYWATPVREIVSTLEPTTTAVKNKDTSGVETWKYRGANLAVEPTIKLLHKPTGQVLARNQAYNAAYTNAMQTPTNGNPVQANAKATTLGIANVSSYPRLVNNFWGNSDVTNTSQNLMIDLPYLIDYPTFKITLNAAGGIGTDTINHKIGATNPYEPFNGNERPAPTREGYVFKGFYAEKNAKGTKYFDSIIVDGYAKAKPNSNRYNQANDTTFYAAWEPLTYKIRFWSDYGDGSEYVAYTLSDKEYERAGDETSALLKPATYGDLVLPSAHDLGISRDHYDFVGWNIYEEQDWAMYKAGKTYKAGLTTKQGDIVNIYAAWRAKDQLTVSYDANGGTGAPPVDGTWADADFTLSSQIPIRDGYTFKGWNTAAAPEYEKDAEGHYVLDEQGNKVQTNGHAYESGEEVKQKSGTEDNPKAIRTAVTMYAQWERNPSVTYRANGGSIQGTIPTQYPTAHSTVHVDFETEVTRDGYDFAGWKDRESGELYTADGTDRFTMGEKSVVLEAKWEPKKMDIDFLIDGTDGLWEHDGWRYGDAEGNTEWENKETARAFNAQQVDYDSPFEFTVVVDTKKVDASNMRLRINDINTDPISTTEKTVGGNTFTVYKFKINKVRGGQMINAVGLVGQTYPVILDAGDGELVGNVTSHTFGEETNLPIRTEDVEDEDGNVTVEANAPKLNGYAFKGWFTSATPEEGDEAVTKIADDVYPTTDDNTLKFYAKWDTSKYSIAFDIGPKPGVEGSALHWIGETDEEREGSEADYEEFVENHSNFKNIKYSTRTKLPDISEYLEYKYMADIDGEGRLVEATFQGWALKKDATTPDFSPTHAVSKLTDKDGATVKLYPVWGAPHYKLVLDPNGGKLTETISGYQAGQMVDLPEPVRPGFEFKGWFTSKTPAEDADPVERINSDTLGEQTYYAKWAPFKYNYILNGVNLEATDSDEIYTNDKFTSDEMTVGDTATLDLPPEITAPEGKTLAGWTDKYTLEEKAQDSGDDEGDEGEGSGTVEKVLTPGDMLFMAGETTDKLWEMGTDAQDKPICVGKTLYPIWKSENSKIIRYDANGGSEGLDFVETEDPEYALEFEMIPVRTGYEFVGWSEDKDAAPDDEGIYKKSDDEENPTKVEMTKSWHLYAVWKAIPYTITYDANLGSDDGKAEVGFKGENDEWTSTITQDVDEFEAEVAVNPAVDPVRGDFYEFLGWSTEANGAVEYQKGSIISGYAKEGVNEETKEKTLEGKTLYAVWLVKSPTYLTFDANGGTGAPSMETYPQNTEVSVGLSDTSRVKPKYRGHTFKGWAIQKKEEDAEEYTYEIVDKINTPDEPAGSVTVYAVWEKDKGLNVAYEHDAMGSAPYDANTYYQDNTASIIYRPAPSKTGYTFIGWDVLDDDGQTAKTLRMDNEEDATLTLDEEVFEYADKSQDPYRLRLKAAFKPNKYTVTFDGNGAEGEAPADIEKTYDAKATVPAVPEGMQGPRGFDFKGWNTAEDGSGQMLQPSETETKWDLSNAEGDIVTLYAIWEAAKTDVSFDNGDSAAYSRSFGYGEVLPDDLAAPKKAGYDFQYYYIEEYDHNDNGEFLKPDGTTTTEKSEAKINKVKYYDEYMEPQRAWDKTKDDLKFQVGGGNTFNMKAAWEAQTYMISYHDENGVLVDSREVTYGVNFRVADDANLEVPAGYRHIGWALNPESEDIEAGLEKDANVKPTKENGLYNANEEGDAQTVSVYAIYQELRKFTVNYDANGGTDAPQDTNQYEDGAKVEIKFDQVPTRANYDFIGWTTQSNTSSVLPGAAFAGQYYGNTDVKGVESIDGKKYHYTDENGVWHADDTGSGEQTFKIRKDVKLYAVWVQKTYYTVDFFGNSTSNGGAANSVKVKGDTFTGPDNKTYTASSSEDGYKTDEAIYRTTSKYNFLHKPTSIKLPDGEAMFTNTDPDAKFMGWSKNSDAKVAEYAAGEVHEDMTMDENLVLSAVWAHPVKNVTLVDIDKPVYEGTPSEDIEATDTSGVSVSKITWTPSADTFAAGTDYKLTVKMKANDGYYFKKGALPTVKMKVQGPEGVEEVTASTELNPEGTVLTATYTFSTTANVIVNGDKDVNKMQPIAVTGVDAPEAGKKLKTVGTAGDSRVDQAHWFPAVTWTVTDDQGQTKEVTGTAEPDTTYTATLKIKPAKGYEFVKKADQDITRVTFSGEEVPFSAVPAEKMARVDEQTGELIVSWTFPATAKIDNDINLKLNGKLRNNQNLPDQTITTADNVDKDSRVADITWFKGGEKVNVEKHKITPNTTYVAQVTLKPASGFTFNTQTVVTFGGDLLRVQAANAQPEGNNWAKLDAEGNVIVSHDFTSSADVLQEIVAPGSLTAEYGTKVSEVEDLPREVQVITENGKTNVDVSWIGDENKIIVVTDEGTEESTDAAALSQKRVAHIVKIQGDVAVPAGVTIPDGMEAKTTLTIKVAADPRLAPEATAAELAEQAQAVIDRTPADAEPVTQDLKEKLEKALNDMNDYIDTWDDENPSTVDGINDEMDKVRAAMYDLMNALEPIPVLPVKKLGEIAIGEKLPTQALSTDSRVHDDSKPAEISWTNATKDTRVEEGKTYEAHIILKPAFEDAFREGGLVVFDDNVQIEIHGSENTDGNRAWIDSEGNLHIIRTITVDKINLEAIDDCTPLNAEFGDSVESVGLPKTVTAYTDAGERKLTVNWNTEGIDLGDTEKREAHDVVVSGKAVKPDSIENPDNVSLDVEITIHVAADPRLVPEKKAEDLNDEAAAVIRDAQDAEIAEEEVAALQAVLDEMNDYIDDLDESTVNGINEKIKDAQDALDALKSFIEHNTVIEMTLFGTDESNGHKLDIGEKLKTTYNLVTATDKDNSVKTTAVKTRWGEDGDNIIESATDYLVEVTLTASDKAQFNVNRKIDFDGVEILMSADEPANDATSYAVLSADKKSVRVARTYTSVDAKFESANAIEDKSVEFGTEPTLENLGLPEKDGLVTSDKVKDYEAEIEWDLSAYEEDYNNRNDADAGREAHEITVSGTLKAVEGVTGVEGETITAKIKIAADPRLEKEAAAATLDEKAKGIIEQAKKAGVGANEIAALEESLQAMRDEVSEGNLDRSTAESDQEKIDKVNTDLKALQKVIDNKKAADENAKANTVNESVGVRNGSNISAVDKFLTSRKSDKDPKGSTIAPLNLRSTKQTKKSIKLKLNRASGATKYVIYGNLCGKKYKFKKLKTTTSLKLTVKKIKGKKLKKGKYYKFIAVAIDKNNKVVATSKIIHVAVKGKKVGNHKKITVKKAVINKAKKLNKGKTLKLKAKLVKQSKKIKVRKHRALIYESSNTKVATVSKKGVITARGAGKCYVYVSAQNGVYKRIAVTVR